jgi:hypothetical protein
MRQRQLTCRERPVMLPLFVNGDAAGAFLALKAMAYGDTNRLALTCQAKLTAAA